MSFHIPWDRDTSARAYADFVRSCPLYREMAEALALQVVEPADRVIVDLGAGTGVGTRAALVHAHPQATVWAVEPAAAMMEAGRAAMADPRSRWLLGDVRVLAQVRPERSVDALLCNAALWLDTEPAEALSLILGLLRARGRFGFSIPAEYLGEVAHMVAPEATAFAGAIEEVRRAALCRVPPGEIEAVLGSVGARTPLPPNLAELVHLLEDVGFCAVQVERCDTFVTAEERARWYALPPILEGWLPGLDPERRAAASRLLRLRARNLPPLRLAWLVIRAEHP